VLRQFEPDLVMLSAGFDAHESDPLGGMRLTVDAFVAMTLELRAIAEECCRGRLVAVTEGGYDLQALGTSLDAVIAALSGPSACPRWPSSGIASSRGRSAADAASQALSGFWTLDSRR
jgi:acetoin utilization deacetylase AcuC-like enzyme